MCLLKRGGESYSINGENVSEEEYNAANTGGIIQKFESGNDSSINEFTMSGSGYGGTWEPFGTSHNEPGKIKIDIDTSKVNESIDIMLDSELTAAQATKLEEFIESALGVVDVSLQGKSIKDAYTEIKALSDAQGITGKNFQIAGVICSVAIEPAIDILDLENLWDADDNEIAKALNGMSKVGKNTLLVLGVIELATGGTASAVLLYAGIIFTIVDAVIKDPDDLRIFSINANGQLEYDFDLKDLSGTLIHFNGTINLDYDDPHILINQVYLYLESGKLQLSFQLDKLRNTREQIIAQVQSDVEDDILSLASGSLAGKSEIDYTSHKDVRNLCKVYKIPELYYGYEIARSAFPVDTATLKYRYRVEISWRNEKLYYEIKSVCINTPLISLDSILYNPWESPTFAVLNTIPTKDDISNHFNSYFKSYYSYHYLNNGHVKDEEIKRIASEEWVNTGKVDIRKPFEFEGGTTVLPEADEQKANFMSRDRNLLAKLLVDDFYNSVIDEVNKYSSLTDKVEALESELVSAWDSLYVDKGASDIYGPPAP